RLPVATGRNASLARLMRTISDDEEVQARDRAERDRDRPRRKKRRPRPSSARWRLLLSLAGEGRDVGEGDERRHIYTYLAAVDEYGVVHGEARDPEGLTFAACVELIMSLPKDALLVGYMLSYDWTKILERLDPEDIFYLLRPDARASRIC